MRASGILQAVASLPSRHGIGDFGPSAKEFIDLLNQSGVKIWQILPLNPVGYGHSPYQPFSSKAMDELYISLDLLYKDGLLKSRPRSKYSKAKKINYEELRPFKEKYYRKAYKEFLKHDLHKLNSFIKKESWVYNYAIFMTFKKRNNMVSWNFWPQEEQDFIVDRKLDLKP